MTKVRVIVKKGKLVSVQDLTAPPIDTYEKLRRVLTRNREFSIKALWYKLNSPIVYPN